MAKIKFELNKAGVKELLSSGEAQAVCKPYADRVMGAVQGIPGYYEEPRKYPERAGYIVVARDFPAIADNLKNNKLLRLLK